MLVTERCESNSNNSITEHWLNTIFQLGGIVKPNDGECHLDNGGLYTHSTIQDYPSISQVNLKVKQNAINVIFAVTANQINIYDKLKDNIEGASSGTLSEDSSNVVDLVRDQYDVCI